MHPEFERVAPPGSSGVKILIIGAGYGGLSCAIECIRKGHQVTILEKVKELKVQGDILSLGPNAGRVLARWGLHDQLWPICGHHAGLSLHNYLGELIRYQAFEQPLFGAYSYNGHRAEIHEVLYHYAETLGAQIMLGKEVASYWEDEERGVSGVNTTHGEVYEADLVVAADGVRSKARQYVLGYNDTPRTSGYAVYRAWFDAAEQGVDKDPLTQYLCTGDVLYGWIGQDVHMLTSSSRNGKTISWVITHKDDAPLSDQWSFPGKMEDVLKIVEGWDPRCAAILSKAPACIDWKLIVHDPLPTWVSKRGRVILLGDAAHPFLPTSVQGASQAIEDGVTLAVVLQFAGKGSSVPLAVRSWEHIRYQRVRDAQLMGESTRDKWHRVKPDERGEHLDMPRPEWLFAFDAESHAYSVYEDVARNMTQDGYKLPTLS